MPSPSGRPSPSERVRLRFKEEMAARGITQDDIAARVTRSSGEVWSQGDVSKRLTGRVQLTVDDAALIAEALGMHLSEAVRDRGLEFAAELTPMQMRIVEVIQRDPLALQTVAMVLRLPGAGLVPAEALTEVRQKRRRGRPRSRESGQK